MGYYKYARSECIEPSSDVFVEQLDVINDWGFISVLDD